MIRLMEVPKHGGSDEILTQYTRSRVQAGQKNERVPVSRCIHSEQVSLGHNHDTVIQHGFGL